MRAIRNVDPNLILNTHKHSLNIKQIVCSNTNAIKLYYIKYLVKGTKVILFNFAAITPNNCCLMPTFVFAVVACHDIDKGTSMDVNNDTMFFINFTTILKFKWVDPVIYCYQHQLQNLQCKF